MLIFLLVVFLIIILFLVRNELVYRERLKVIESINIHNYRYIQQQLKRISYEKMLFHWEPVKSFLKEND